MAEQATSWIRPEIELTEEITDDEQTDWEEVEVVPDVNETDIPIMGHLKAFEVTLDNHKKTDVVDVVK